ncbi:MAG TPA: alpha/beta hydrolase [Solirubrobacteraceae bacterium]|jgi:pimeloyl-ACP methyl ester carboxylesterase|nr:alpha/beta hydrolase [Solirubrobacteraceae bacterium]
MTAVEFQSAGVRCAATHLPGHGDEFGDHSGRRPCVVLGHGFAGTVDSGLLPFAQRFAAAGLDALAFDYRHFGLSDGEPRQLVSVRRQLDDWAAAVSFARSLPQVDPQRIVLWGSSYSGGHVVAVAVADGAVAAVISQVPAMDGLTTVANVARYAGPAQLARFVLAGLRDVAATARGRPPVTLAVVGPPGSVAVMSPPDAEPGYRAIAGPTWRNEVPARIMLTAARHRPGLLADKLRCPILVQIADRDSVAPVKAAQDAAWRATGRAELRTYPVGHFDVYRGAPFEQAVSDQLHFLKRHLRERSREPALAPV